MHAHAHTYTRTNTRAHKLTNAHTPVGYLFKIHQGQVTHGSLYTCKCLSILIQPLKDWTAHSQTTWMEVVSSGGPTIDRPMSNGGLWMDRPVSSGGPTTDRPVSSDGPTMDRPILFLKHVLKSFRHTCKAVMHFQA